MSIDLDDHCGEWKNGAREKEERGGEEEEGKGEGELEGEEEGKGEGEWVKYKECKKKSFPITIRNDNKT